VTLSKPSVIKGKSLMSFLKDESNQLPVINATMQKQTGWTQYTRSEGTCPPLNYWFIKKISFFCVCSCSVSLKFCASFALGRILLILVNYIHPFVRDPLNKETEFTLKSYKSLVPWYFFYSFLGAVVKTNSTTVRLIVPLGHRSSGVNQWNK
jgi:hypothetical protein